MLYNRKSIVVFWLLCSGLVFSLTGCQWEQQSNAQPQSGGPAGQSGGKPGGGERPQSPPVVDMAQVTVTSDGTSYTGTTQSQRTVSVRSRVEGQLLSLGVDVGDRVEQGQVLAQLDGNLLQTAVNQAEAELAARRFEVEQAKAQVSEAQAQVAAARVALQQAQVDADRFAQLSAEGALATQEADLAQTTLQTAQQSLKSAQEQVKTRQKAIASLSQRVQAQSAIVTQAKQRLTYTTLTAPLTGTVLSRLAEAGDLMQPGETIVEMGDLQTLEVAIQISDRDLTQFRLGQRLNVRLDAFPNEVLEGTVTEISPIADTAARLVPVEVTIANPAQKISSGLLARVSVRDQTAPRFKIPESALNLAQNPGQAVVFVPTSDEAETTVEARPVEIGQRENGQVEILSGLERGQTFIVNSDRPLQAGDKVRRSFLSGGSTRGSGG